MSYAKYFDKRGNSGTLNAFFTDKDTLTIDLCLENGIDCTTPLSHLVILNPNADIQGYLDGLYDYDYKAMSNPPLEWRHFQPKLGWTFIEHKSLYFFDIYPNLISEDKVDKSRPLSINGTLRKVEKRSFRLDIRFIAPYIQEIRVQDYIEGFEKYVVEVMHELRDPYSKCYFKGLTRSKDEIHKFGIYGTQYIYHATDDLLPYRGDGGEEA